MATLTWEYDDGYGPEVQALPNETFARHHESNDFLNNLFFFFNVFTYVVYCSFLAAFAFPYGEFIPTRDYCVEGAYVELFYATQLG